MDEHIVRHKNYGGAVLLRGVAELRASQQLQDVVLMCEGGAVLQAHSAVLAAASRFFRTLLVHQAAWSSRHTVVALPQTPASLLAPLVDFMYSGEASVDRGELKQFLQLAEALQVTPLCHKDAPARTPSSGTVPSPSTSVLSPAPPGSWSNKSSLCPSGSVQIYTPEGAQDPRIPADPWSGQDYPSQNPLASPTHNPEDCGTPPDPTPHTEDNWRQQDNNWVSPEFVGGVTVKQEMMDSQQLDAGQHVMLQEWSATNYSDTPRVQESFISTATPPILTSAPPPRVPHFATQDQPPTPSAAPSLLTKRPSAVGQPSLESSGASKRPKESCGSERWRCDLCHKSYKHKAHLYRHMKHEHVTSADPHTHPCGECGKMFHWSHTLQRHRLNAHGRDANPRPCLLCGRMAKNAQSLASHMSAYHNCQN